jgi:UDP-N-acetylmuramyl tripeptide synthase
VIGGRVAAALDPSLLAGLSRGRRIALLSATNGKTTMTHLLAAAARTGGPVATNDLGANMGPGLVAALGDDAAPTAVLEVDERWLPQVLRQVGPCVVVLGNLSRDQLDRTQEVRKIAALWRDTLADTPTHAVVANADDPLVVWAAEVAPVVRWVAPGAFWTLDAVGCPWCGGTIGFAADGRTWSCTVCAAARPDPQAWVDGDALVWRDGDRRALQLGLPGRANRANAALALVAAEAMHLDRAEALAAIREVAEVAGRYRRVTRHGTTVRLLMAKNPAGWQEAIDMLAPPPVPLVAAINARIADGRDPSWLWDVPFERLRGRTVVAVGERRHDLAVRLRYADVDHEVADDLDAALTRLAADTVDYIGNYTAFQDELARAAEGNDR